MDTLLHFANLVLHIDTFLGDFIHQYGAWVYAVLFLIVFAETGLVILPFLPGDSLLFIGGAFCATGEMSLPLLIVLLFLAAVTGNTVNWVIDLPGKAISAGGKLLGVNSSSAPAPTAAPAPGATPPAAPAPAAVPAPAADPQRRNYL